MNTEKVFTAYTKEGKEILLYRKDNNSYMDLMSDNNEVVSIDKIDLKTLAYASKSINLRKHMLSSSIKRKYKKDREKIVETKNILFGLEHTIKNLKETKTDSGWRFYNIPQYDYSYNWDYDVNDYLDLFEFKRTLVIDDKTYNIYTNLYDKKEYILFNNSVKGICMLPSFKEGMKYIYANGTSLEDEIKESIVTKKKVYEYAYETRNTKIEK